MQQSLLFWPLMATALMAAGILLAGMLRGSLPPVVGVFGIVVLPGLCFILENSVLMERAKEASFCGSCHEMAPILASARDGGETLAAIHFQAAFPRAEGCYECHSGYGVWGDLNAKLAGVAHMWVALTNTTEYPISHRGPVDIRACLGCHEGSRAFDAVETHVDPDLRSALESGELGCSGTCHPVAHAPEALAEPREKP